MTLTFRRTKPQMTFTRTLPAPEPPEQFDAQLFLQTRPQFEKPRWIQYREQQIAEHPESLRTAAWARVGDTATEGSL